MARKYTKKSFWAKLMKHALDAGRKVVEKALQLYYAAQEEGTPTWAKAEIYAALAYFIWPADAIPDAIPVVGYSDDLGVLAAALITCAAYITPKVKRKAKKALNDLFGAA